MASKTAIINGRHYECTDITWPEFKAIDRPEIELRNPTEDDFTITFNVTMSEEDHATAMRYFDKIQLIHELQKAINRWWANR